MKLKTNKSILKRLRITKNRKVVAQVSGQNHFNSKESGNTTRAKRIKQILAPCSMTKSIKHRVVNQ